MMGVDVRIAGVRIAVLGAVAGTALIPAGAAHANVVGIGNATFGNACVNHGGTAAAAGATVSGSGLGSGNVAGLPLSLPRNDCGNSGIICIALIPAAE
ncbi:chaplin family protein [Streptomyces cyaneofuscatus]|uniref:chaplin family protein n=1 Tax=Streptomyces cyaneofuscatus TaxID=66883 RepID=UPI0033281DB5